ncbi:MAG: hypothetical protein GX190_03085 [Mollicutes bacterium]|nr:hypothetical protein [Mollicutes bacterium]
MELIIILGLLLTLTYIFRKVNTFVYALAALDIFFRIVDFLKSHLLSPEIYKFINQHFPSSIPSLINKYTSGIFNEILIWLYVINFMIFEFYIIKAIFNKRK